MRFEHLLDSRRRHATFEPRHDAALPHEHERRHRRDAEPCGDVGALVDVDLLHGEMLALLARDVREQALHPARGPGTVRGEEDEQRLVAGHRRCNAKVGSRGTYTPGPMGAWYWIGVAAGLGAAAGVLLAGVARATIVAVALGAAAGAGLGVLIDVWQPGGWGDIAAGVAGGALGGFGAAVIVVGALRRGGTRAGTALLVAGAAVLAGGLAWAPALGYVEALVLPLLALRARRRRPDTYAGLRTLARD
jgi:hypothetical protein